VSTALPSANDVLAYEFVAAIRRVWWIPLILGIVWTAFSLVVFRFDIHSVNAVGILAGIVFLVAGVEELLTVGTIRGGWRWFHALIGVILFAGGILSFIHPGNTFLGLAKIVGWLLLAKGLFDVIVALANRHLELWWIRMVIGLIELGLAFIVSASLERRAVFLLLFVGATALMRGIALLVVAFQLRSAT
jgi:uncharacterized membrane protein HdeD (DUF308 family)